LRSQYDKWLKLIASGASISSPKQPSDIAAKAKLNAKDVDLNDLVLPSLVCFDNLLFIVETINNLWSIVVVE
jgi:hypothetical protein